MAVLSSSSSIVIVVFFGGRFGLLGVAAGFFSSSESSESSESSLCWSLVSFGGVSCVVGDLFFGVPEGPVFGSGVMAVDPSVSLFVLAFCGVPVTSANDSCLGAGFLIAFALVVMGVLVFSGVSVAAKASLVCRAPLFSISFAFATFACLACSPRLGLDCLPLLLGVLLRFFLPAMVVSSRSCGTLGA